MQSFESSFDNLLDSAVCNLNDLVYKHGEESDHVGENVLKVTDDEMMFNLEGGRYLTEYSPHYGLIDNNGYQYSVYSLEAEKFFQVVDYLIKKYKVEEPKEEKKLDYFERQRIVNEQRAMDGDNSILGNPAY